MDDRVTRTGWRCRARRLAGYAGLTALFAYFFWHASVKISHDKAGDFGHFYYAAQAMHSGADIYASWRQGYLYPPMWAFVIMPLARLGMRDAAIVQAAVTAAVGIGVLLLMSREVERRLLGGVDAARTGVIALLTCLVVSGPLRADIEMGQTNEYVLLGVVVALWGVDRLPAVAGFALGFAFNIKFQVVAFLPYLLVRRRWGAAAWMAAGIVLWSVLPASWTGWKTNLHYLGVSYSGVLDLVGIDTGMGVAAKNPLSASFSLSACSSIARLMEPGREGIAMGLTGLLAAGCCGAAYSMYRRARAPFLAWPAGGRAGPPWAAHTAVEWAGLMVVALVFSPQTNARHLVLMTLPAACAVSLAFSRPRVRRLAIWSLAVMLLGIAFPPGMAATRDMVRWWRESGAEAGCLLISYALLLRASLLNAQRWSDESPWEAFAPRATGARTV